MFKFKGKSSKEMGVIIEEEQLFLAKAAQKYEEIDINGRNGSIFNELGYSNVEIPMNVQILNSAKLDDIFEWLNGPGEFEYNGRVTTAYFYNEILPQRMVSIKNAEITFKRSPFWKLKESEFQTITTEIQNEGNVFSKPIIRLEKVQTDEIDVSIAGIRFQYNFNNETYVEIDCNECTATYNNLNRNRNLIIGFEFPKLLPGKNPIIIHSGDPIIKIKDKDRWL